MNETPYCSGGLLAEISRLVGLIIEFEKQLAARRRAEIIGKMRQAIALGATDTAKVFAESLGYVDLILETRLHELEALRRQTGALWPLDARDPTHKTT